MITAFSAAPEIINPGESVELAWQATGGKLYLYRLDDLGRLTMPAYQVPVSGTMVLTTSTTVRNQVSFALFAIDSATGAQAQATLSVQVRCPDIWFFPDGPASCPLPAQTGSAAVEHFERGLMVWLGWQNRIYALYSDDQLPAWEAWMDRFTEGQPEFDPSIIPPAGLYQPIRGFGLIWREETSGGRRVRDRLGWATDQEVGITGAFQCEAAPKYATCYMRGPGDTVLVLRPEASGWSVWATPTP